MSQIVDILIDVTVIIVLGILMYAFIRTLLNRSIYLFLYLGIYSLFSLGYVVYYLDMLRTMDDAKRETVHESAAHQVALFILIYTIALLFTLGGLAIAWL
jgi:hypothetical protein